MVENIKLEEVELKPKKDSFLDKFKGLFVDKKKRALYIMLFILPFVIAIGIFGFIAYKEAKSLVDLATNSTASNPNYQISSMNYVLRDNATEVQQEYFAQLKDAIENNTASDEETAGLVCKNFIADFYTWSNKQGQYDVGGLYYIYSGTNPTGHYNEQTYILIRDSFYKYLSNYINEYGAENLLEVESVEVTKAKKSSDLYLINERTGWEPIDEESYQEVFGDVEYDAYEVTCKWTYKQNDKFDTSKYATSMNFVVVFRENRFEIVEASEKAIDVRKVEIEETESESGSDE